MTLGGDLLELQMPALLTGVRDGSVLLPTPTVQASKHGPTRDVTANSHGHNLWDIPYLLPTPVVNDMGDDKTLDWWDKWTAEKKIQHGNGNGHGKSLSIELRRYSDSTPQPSTDGNASSDEQPRLF
jgi:hypothetical protein